MIYLNQELETEIRPGMRGGSGEVTITHLADEADLCEKGRLFAILDLKPHCGIGWHVHENDTEIFHVLEGSAEYNDDGKISILHKGDTAVCPVGSGHAVCNKGESACRILALILNA